MSNSYHNTTAHFNAYYIADEYIKDIKEQITNGYEWNYNLVLPIFPPFDSMIANSYTAQIEDCIEKASMSIQHHKGSKWEDDAYVLVGLARFYSFDFVNAIETFKYVNSKGKDDSAKHKALVALMRTFIEYAEFNNAIVVSDYLKKEKLNRQNLQALYLTRAYLYQKSNDLNNMVQNLIQAAPLISNRKERGRINFIIGQVYQSLRLDGEAYKYYQLALKNNPPYELSFYTKLNMAQVTQLAKKDDAKKIRRYFKKLLRDRKNEIFKDKIYYEMGTFEVRHHQLELGIDLFKSSIRHSSKNKRQKAHSYWSLGKLYYDSLKNYKLAKLYYDSTLSVLPKDEVEYLQIENRQQVLDNFVTQLTVIHTNDSLLTLSLLSHDSLTVFLQDYIVQQEALEKERRKIEKKRKQNEERLSSSQSNGIFDQNTATIGGSNYGNAIWYFYNPTAVTKGISTFKRIWGDRMREENWRLNSKNAAHQSEKTTKDKADEDEESEEEFQIDITELLTSLPDTDAKKQKLLDEIEEATYLLGNIYKFDLDEKENATRTYENMLIKFPQSKYRYELMYILYIIFKESEQIEKSDRYKNLLINEAPESIYAKIVLNPNYKAESQAANEKMKKIYEIAYEHYKSSNYKAALGFIYDGLSTYTDNDYVDNMVLLKILVQGKTAPTYKYQYELNNFKILYPKSELFPYVSTLLAASIAFQINHINSTQARFKTDINVPHFFAFIYETNLELSDTLSTHFKTITQESNRLSIGNLVLDTKYSLVLISEFAGKEEAITFNEKIEIEKTKNKINKSSKCYNFVIAKDNFNILYQTRELDTYLTFYGKHYQQ